MILPLEFSFGYIKDLIHGSNINDPAASKCSVTAVLSISEDEEKRFQRIVKVSGNDAISDYRIDGKVAFRFWVD